MHLRHNLNNEGDIVWFRPRMQKGPCTTVLPGWSFPLRYRSRIRDDCGLYFAWVLRYLKKLYSCTIESILTGCITAWYGNCSASDRKALQRVVRMAQYITGAKLPAIQDLYTRRCQRKALNIFKDSSHPSHRLFALLPHGKRYRSAKSRSKRLLNRF